MVWVAMLIPKSLKLLQFGVQALPFEQAALTFPRHTMQRTKFMNKQLEWSRRLPRPRG